VDLVLASDASLGLISGRIIRVVEVDCTDAEAAASDFVAGVVDLSLDAVVGVDDSGVMVAALAAQRLGLPHNDPAAVAATRDKASMRALLSVAGIDQPRYAVVRGEDEAVAAATAIGYPVVLKPLSLSASRGVIKADDDAGLREAWSRLAGIRAEAGIIHESVLVEEFLPGPEVAVEGLLSGSGLEILAVFDKPDPLDGPYFEETIYVSPSRHAAATLDAVHTLVESSVRSLGLAFGPVHAEVRLTPDGPRLIEVAARSIGGLCGRALQFGMLSQSLEVLLLRAALGMNRRGMGPVEQASGAMMIPIPAAGVLRSVRGIEAIAEVEGVTEVTITVAQGRPIRPLPEGDRYLGFIIARGDSPADVEGALREAHGLLEIVIEMAEHS
jgi:biotin carboxylase